MLFAVFLALLFSLPPVMQLLERKGILSAESYRVRWKIGVLVLAIAAMSLSPEGDPNSLVLMLVPLVGAYFVGAWLCKRRAANRRAPSP
ncbi:MAG TPA: twin-arginine translocase subunit TatC [Pirellulales bacterium]|nr:twin-arginine translocase subunit TatC [Pirellulales bacterium]